MEATATLSLQSNTWSGFEKSCRNPSGFLRISRKNAVERDLQTLNLQNSRFRRASVRSKHATLAISCSVKKSTGIELDFDTFADVLLFDLCFDLVSQQSN